MILYLIIALLGMTVVGIGVIIHKLFILLEGQIAITNNQRHLSDENDFILKTILTDHTSIAKILETIKKGD